MSTPRCTICDCVRVPLDRENTKFGACTNIECRDPLYDYRSENPYKSVPKPAEGVAAPLEPSARDKDIEQLERERERVGQEFGHVRWTEAEKQPDGSYKAGVAAPLEPTIDDAFVEQIEDAVGMGHGAWDMVDPVEICKAVAAAVSKNLQEELCPKCEDPNNLGHSPCTKFSTKRALIESIERLLARILELEKEITALREKP